MKAVPDLVPAWFPHAATGSDASALWLACMGTVESLLGGAYLIKHHVILPLFRPRVALPRRAPARVATARNPALQRGA